MPDVFLSYNREDQAVARRFAEAFDSEGLSVWWDVTLRSGEEYDRVTERALNEAKAVVVLWSANSVDSRWVRAEATQGLRNGTLVPAMIGACKRPIMFELIQTAELGQWRGDPRDKAWAAFLVDVRRHVAKDSVEAAAPRPPPQVTSARPPRRLVVTGSMALAALAVVAIAVFTLMRPQAVAPDGSTAQRTAFFGFSVEGDDPVAAAIARSATGETFNTLSALGLETASASKTQNIERSAQLEYARDLGARYALSGDVRRDGDQFWVAIRLEDVEVGTMLLDDTLTGDESERISLPVRAAARATNALQCYIDPHVGLRNLLKAETGEITRAMVRVCSTGQLEARRELARLAPDSPGMQANLALWLFLTIGGVPESDRPAIRQEIEAALKAVQAKDPANGFARAIRAHLLVVDGKSLADAEKLYLAVDRDLFFPNIRYGIFLRSVGRYRDATPYLEAAVRQSPLLPATWGTLAHTLANVGQRERAERIYDDAATRLPDAINWQAWMVSALFDGAGVPGEVLKRAPPGVSGDTVACWKDIEGALSRNAKQDTGSGNRVIACTKQGSLMPLFAIEPTAALGKTEDAFLLARQAIDRSDYSFDAATALFVTGSRAMRKHPDFLPFVKKLGLYQYWLDTDTHPDVCDLPEEKELEVCASLRSARGSTPASN